MIKGFSHFAVLCVLVLAGCGETSLRTAQNRASTLQAQHEAVIAAYGGLYAHARPAAYVQAIVEKVLAARPADALKDKQFSAYVLDNDGVDAFAITDGRSGWIYITRGLLAIIGDEAQLASLLAHEIAHIDLKHTRYRRTNSANVRVERYSHNQERRADMVGIEYVAAAGYQPSSHRQILSTLQQYAAFLQGKSEGAEGREDGENANTENIAWARAHRITPARIERVTQAVAAQSGANKAKRFIRAQKRYLNAIDGLVFIDEQARPFFVRGRRLFHKIHAVQFEVPQGFLFTSLGGGSGSDGRGGDDKVIARHKNGLELVFDSAPYLGAYKADAYMQEEWARALSLAGVRAFALNDKPSAQGEVREAEQGVELLVIQHKEQWLRFALFSPPHLSGQAKSVMSAIRRSIIFSNNDTAQNKGNKKIVRVVLVQGGDSVSHLAQRMRVKGDRAALFRILNGLEKGGILRRGAPVKLID